MKFLLFSHEMSLTGAPLSLLQMAKALKKNGHKVVVRPLASGPLEQSFVDAGIEVTYKNEIDYSYFDKIIVNTLLLSNVIQHLMDKVDMDKVIWWLHEGPLFEQIYEQNFHIIKQVKHIIVPSNTLKEYVESYAHKAEIVSIYNGIEDNYIEPIEHNNIRFCLVGSIEPHKGIDILIDAVRLINEKKRKKISVSIIGDQQTDYGRKQMERSKSIKEIRFLPNVSHVELLKFISTQDVLICSSRFDTFPTTVTEALMMRKPAIISNVIGHMEIEALRYNSFESGNKVKLKNLMMKYINNPQQIGIDGALAHYTYERLLTDKIYEENIIKYLC